jgi:hypothetical protein
VQQAVCRTRQCGAARIRSHGAAVATAVEGAASLVSEFFVSLIDAIGNSTTSSRFAFCCGVSWL